MTETNNLHLPQWEETDRIHHDDFNDAMAKIDTAVAALDTAVSSGVKMATGTYTGAGTSGSDHPNTLTFSFAPKLIFIASSTCDFANIKCVPLIGMKGVLCTFRRLGSSQSGDIGNRWTFSGNTISWYTLGIGGVEGQMNCEGEVYTYIAIG